MHGKPEGAKFGREDWSWGELSSLKWFVFRAADSERSKEGIGIRGSGNIWLYTRGERRYLGSGYESRER
jgi:hypothetical protein